MLKNNSKLEWEYLAEEDQETPWPPDSQGPDQQSEPELRQRMRRALLFAMMMVVFLTAGIGGVYARNEALQGVDEVERGVQAAAEAEKWVQEHASSVSVEMLVDNLASRYVTTMADAERNLLAAAAHDETFASVMRIHDTWFAGGSAAAEVTLTLAGAERAGDAVYRQTRFYRETPTGWLRTKPDPRLWGPSVSLDTEHLAWRFRQRDQSVVLEIAEAMDALYAQLRQDYGLGELAVGEKLNVHVQVDYLPVQVPLQRQESGVITVPSPSVYLVPLAHVDAEILAQGVALAFLQSILIEVNEQHDVYEAYDVLAGLRLWETWDAGLGLSKQSEEVIRWYVGGAASAGGDAALNPSRDFSELCVAFGVWMIRPVASDIPFYCEHVDSGPLLYPAISGTQTFPVLIGPAAYDAVLRHVGTTDADLTKPMLLSTVVDFAVTAYGRESLPTLVMALGDHKSWETLVPAVYGVSFEEFERSWRQHVASLVQ